MDGFRKKVIWPYPRMEIPSMDLLKRVELMDSLMDLNNNGLLVALYFL